MALLRHLPLPALLATGLLAYLTVGRGVRDFPDQLILVVPVAAFFLLYFVPGLRRRAEGLMRSVGEPTPRARAMIAWAIAVLAAGYLAYTAHGQGRYLRPHWHDELGYVIQIRMLAEGRLWMPGHPLHDFFETFYLITTDRAYASIYFPGTALMLTPAVWVGIPLYLAVIFASAGMVGLLYRVVAELIDGSAGLVAALMLVATGMFRTMSVKVMSQIPVALLGLLLVWAFLRWRGEHRLRWALVMGALAGWAGVTRPVDALAVTVPVAVAILVELRRSQTVIRWRQVPVMVVAALPFLGLQVLLNHKITGDWKEPPWQFYSRRDFPQTTIGFRAYDPAIRPVSTLPQKVAMYDLYVPSLAAEHRPSNIAWTWYNWRLRSLFGSSLPHPGMLVFVFAGFLGLGGRARWVLALALPSFICLYTFSVVFQDYYALTVAPAVIVLSLLGVEVIGERWIGSDRRSRFRGAMLAAIGLLCVLMVPEVNRGAKDELFEPTLMREVDRWIDEYEGPRAVVLFAYVPGRDLHQEPVYNADVAWPDDARVVRANDLGERNGEIFGYYARKQPDRVFYRFEGPGRVRYLGRGLELAGRER